MFSLCLIYFRSFGKTARALTQFSFWPVLLLHRINLCHFPSLSSYPFFFVTTESIESKSFQHILFSFSPLICCRRIAQLIWHNKKNREQRSTMKIQNVQPLWFFEFVHISLCPRQQYSLFNRIAYVDFDSWLNRIEHVYAFFMWIWCCWLSRYTGEYECVPYVECASPYWRCIDIFQTNSSTNKHALDGKAWYL